MDGARFMTRRERDLVARGWWCHEWGPAPRGVEAGEIFVDGRWISMSPAQLVGLGLPADAGGPLDELLEEARWYAERGIERPKPRADAGDLVGLPRTLRRIEDAVREGRLDPGEARHGLPDDLAGDFEERLRGLAPRR